MSLYLSSQLMYGVVRVYRKQSDYLLDDVTNFFCKMRVAVATLDEIDLKAVHRQEQLALDLDDLCADNPWFGALQMNGDLLRSPQLPNLEMWRVESSLSIPKSPIQSPISRVNVPRSPQISITEPMLRLDVGSPHTVSSKEEITLTIPEIDMTLFQDMQIPPEYDLQTFDDKEVRSILEEPVPTDLQMGKFLSPVKVPQYEDLEQNLARGVLSPKEQTPMTRPDNGIPTRRGQLPSPGVTPMPPPEQPVLRARRTRASLNLQLSPVPPSPKRSRKRRHLCIDATIQIDKDQLKENFKNREDIVHQLVLPDLKKSSVQDMFKKPGQRGLAGNAKLIRLWRKNAVYGILETESDIETPAWSVPNLQVDEDSRRVRSDDGSRQSFSDKGSKRSSSDDESRPTRSKRRILDTTAQLSPVPLRQEPELEVIFEEQHSVEIARDASISMERSHISADTPVSIHQRSALSEGDKSRELDRSKGDSVSKKSTKKSRTRGSVSTEDEMEINLMHDIIDNQSLHESIAQLSSVIEEKDIPLTPGPLTTTSTPTGMELLRLIKHYTEREECTTFHDLCPISQYDRCQAAHIFSNLLDLCHGRVIRAEQEKPYGDIYIWRQ